MPSAVIGSAKDERRINKVFRRIPDEILAHAITFCCVFEMFPMSSISKSFQQIVVLGAKNVTSVKLGTLMGPIITDGNAIPLFRSLVKLIKVDLYMSHTTNNTLRTLGEYCPRLTQFNLPINRRVNADACVELFESCRGLTHVDLSRCRGLNDATLLSLTETCGNVKSVNLSALGATNAITDTGVIALATTYGDGLTELDLYNCNNITDAAVRMVAEYCPNLTLIVLTNCNNITDSSIVTLAEACSSIKTIKLHGCSITDTSMITLAKRCTDLETVSFGACDVTDNGVIALAVHCTKLVDVCLCCNDAITCNSIYLLRTHSTIHRINLCGCNSVIHQDPGLFHYDNRLYGLNLME